MRLMLKHLLAELLEIFKRRWCRIWGHVWREDGGESSPVIPLIAVCRRCGKFVRLLNNPEISP